MSLHWARIREAGTLRGMRMMIFVHDVLGRSAFRAILYPVIVYYFVRRGVARRSSIDYLKRVKRRYPGILGQQSVFRLSLRHFRTFGDLLLDKYLAWVSVPDMPVMSPAVGQRLLRLVRERQGCLVLGSHFGNLEYSRAVAARHPELVINVLTYDRHATKFARLMADSGPASRLHLIQVTELDLARALELRERVRQGEWVFIAGDRVPVGDSFRVFRAPFMGEDACFPIGPIVLATLLECPVYLLYCYRLDDHYHLGFERFAERIELPRNDRDRAIGEYVRAYANALEAQVALAPLQWFNFFDFWKAHDG